MNRRDLLRTVGAAGVGAMLPVGRLAASDKGGAVARLQGVDCVLIPQETAGPYPLDLSGDSTKFRQDVTEGRPGTPLNLTMTVVNINDGCAPVPNARVDIWHCDKDGVYSGYAQPGGSTVGQTFMRGIQMTDANGTVAFTTIYPGWYSGRITHIHFQVFLNSVLSATSQMAFPDSLNDTVYATAAYADRGRNTSVANNASDSVFGSPSGDLQYEMLNIVANAGTGGYDATFTVGISAPKAGLINLEPETGGQFMLRQNYPNPFARATSVGFSLTQTSHVRLAIFDMNGVEVARLLDERRAAGEQSVAWDGNVGGVPVARGNFLFRLSVTNALGEFHQAKVMTLH